MEPFSASLQLLWSILGAGLSFLDLMGVDRICFHLRAHGPGTPGTTKIRVGLSSLSRSGLEIC